ncbi:MAG: hypothetical protein H0X25_06060 [Acidobacteriales bacterium]|nr:hypothetical protein [Terriglobales bacterium]
MSTTSNPTPTSYERAFNIQTPQGVVVLRVQQGGAGRFRLAVTLPAVPTSNEVSFSVPSELADLLTNAIGKAADASGE